MSIHLYVPAPWPKAITILSGAGSYCTTTGPGLSGARLGLPGAGSDLSGAGSGFFGAGSGFGEAGLWLFGPLKGWIRLLRPFKG